MKFLCEKCQTKYSIADEKVRRRILKIRCKNCQNIITVRDPLDGAEPGGAGAVHLESALDGAFAASGQMPRTAAPAVVPPPAAPSPPPSDDEWYFSLRGSQEGPMSLAALAARVVQLTPEDPVFAWRDGLDDWTPAYKVPDLKPLLRRPEPTPAAVARADALPAPTPLKTPAAMARAKTAAQAPVLSPVPSVAMAARSAAEPAFAKEMAPAPRAMSGAPVAMAASRPSLASSASPSAAAAPAVAYTEPAEPEPAPGLVPDVERDRQADDAEEGDSAEAFAAQLAHKGPSTAEDLAPDSSAGPVSHAAGHSAAETPGFSADPNVPLPDSFVIDEASRVVRLPLPLPKGAKPGAAVAGAGAAPAAGASTSLPVSRARQGTPVRLVVAAGAVVAVVAAVVIAVLVGSGQQRQGYVSDGVGGEGDNSLVISVGGQTGGVQRRTQTPEPAANRSVRPREPSASGAPTSPPPSQSAAASVAAAAPLSGNLGRLAAGADDTSAAAPTHDAVQMSEDTLRSVVDSGRGALQLCYETALRRNAALSHVSVTISVAIAASGAVSSVQIPDGVDPTLASCMGRLVRNWSWPVNAKDYNFSFPVIFKSE